MLKVLVGEEVVELKVGLVGGILAEDGKSPAGVYNGDKDLQSICTSMEYAMRAFIKTIKDYDETLNYGKIEILLQACMSFALKSEVEKLKEDNLTLSEYRAMKEFCESLILELPRKDER